MSGPPSLAVWKFASCDGCQLTLLDCEDELLTLAEEVRIATFLEASSEIIPGLQRVTRRRVDHHRRRRATYPGDSRSVPYPRHDRRLRHRRRHPGAAQLRRHRRIRLGRLRKARVRRHPRNIHPASAHVQVDYQLQGCPIDRNQLLDTLAALLVGREPRIPAKTVCTECKLRGVTCVAVAEGIPCLGPVTHAGCGALCPAHHRGCYGCFGPASTPNTAALIPLLNRDGMSEAGVERVFSTFNVTRFAAERNDG